MVPIPVHVNRFAVRSQHQQLEKMCLSGPKPDLRKKLSNEAISGFEKFKAASGTGSGGEAMRMGVTMGVAMPSLGALTPTPTAPIALARSIY